MSGPEPTRTPVLNFSLPPATENDEFENLVGQRIGAYRVLELLGRGGSGEVYLAEHPIIKSRVAIKVLRSDIARSNHLVRRFVLEAQAANKIDSPHIVPVSDFGKLADGRPYAVMEFLSGKSLDQLISRDRPLPLDRAIDIVLQIARGMHAAHQEQILHRDLKPANLFLESKDGKAESFVRILDFGIAKFAPTGTDHTLTQHAGPLGTPRYAAPEQLNGGKVDATCDSYAIGTITYELLGGQTPFVGEPTYVIAEKSLRDPEHLSKRRPDLPRKLCDFVMRMISRDPAERPQSLAEVVTFFSSPGAWGGTARRRELWRITFFVAAALGLGLVAWLSWPSRENTAAPRTLPGVSAPKVAPSTVNDAPTADASKPEPAKRVIKNQTRTKPKEAIKNSAPRVPETDDAPEPEKANSKYDKLDPWSED